MGARARVVSFLVAALALPDAARAADPLVENAKDCSQNGMACRYWLPPTYDATKRYPLVVYLHGAGQAGKDNLNHIENWAGMLHSMIDGDTGKPKHPTFLMAPQCPDRWVDANWEDGSYSTTRVAETAAMKEVRAMVEALRGKYPIDPDRIYVMGFSMGGMGTWDLVSRHPTLFAAAVPTAGVAPPNAAPGMKNLAVWSFHNADDTAVPVSSDREMFKALALAGGRPRFVEGASGGHFDDTGNAGHPQFVEWLFAQRRGQPATSLAQLAFSPAGGAVAAPVRVTITSSEPGAKIRYTTDGTIPTATTGQAYTGPVELGKSVVLIAAAFTSERRVYHAAPFKVGESPLPPGAELEPPAQPSPMNGGAGGSAAAGAGGSAPGGAGGRATGGVAGGAAGGAGGQSGAGGTAGMTTPPRGDGSGGSDEEPAADEPKRASSHGGCVVTRGEPSSGLAVAWLALVLLVLRRRARP